MFTPEHGSVPFLWKGEEYGSALSPILTSVPQSIAPEGGEDISVNIYIDHTDRTYRDRTGDTEDNNGTGDRDIQHIDNADNIDDADGIDDVEDIEDSDDVENIDDVENVKDKGWADGDGTCSWSDRHDRNREGQYPFSRHYDTAEKGLLPFGYSDTAGCYCHFGRLASIETELEVRVCTPIRVNVKMVYTHWGVF